MAASFVQLTPKFVKSCTRSIARGRKRSKFTYVVNIECLKLKLIMYNTAVNYKQISRTLQILHKLKCNLVTSWKCHRITDFSFARCKPQTWEELFGVMYRLYFHFQLDAFHLNWWCNRLLRSNSLQVQINCLNATELLYVCHSVTQTLAWPCWKP